MLESPARTLTVLNDGMAQGLHIGAQLHVLIDGQLTVDMALGNARGPEQHQRATPMATDTLMLWLSAGKPITAAAIAMIWEQGLVGLDDPVVRYIPEFVRGGQDKQRITIRHLLTHTAGIRGVDSTYPFATWEETLRRICESRLERDWVPGLHAGYHTHSTWYLLGEIINRVTGTVHHRWIRDHLLVPLGMNDSWLAMEGDTYHGYGARIGHLCDTTAKPPRPLPNLETELAASRPRPSASCRGPMRDLARFYEMLRCGGRLGGRELLRPQTVTAMTMRQRLGMPDQTFGRTLDWGLGLIVNSAHHGEGIPYQFGPYASPHTYGHGGWQSSTGFCDPQHRLVVALVFNGCPGEAAHDRRLRAVLKALYEDLGFDQ